MDQNLVHMISHRPWILKVVFFINWNKFFQTEKFFNFFYKFEEKYFAALFRGALLWNETNDYLNAQL